MKNILIAALAAIGMVTLPALASAAIVTSSVHAATRAKPWAYAE